jgi:hypothetical protein
MSSDILTFVSWHLRPQVALVFLAYRMKQLDALWGRGTDSMASYITSIKSSMSFFDGMALLTFLGHVLSSDSFMTVFGGDRYRLADYRASHDY